MQRQQELAGRKGGMPVIQSWTQGAAHMLDKLFEGIEKGRTNRRIEEGNQVQADVLSQADPVTGLVSPDKLDALASWNPELFAQMLGDWRQNQQFNATLEAQKAKTAADAGPKATDVAAMYDDFSAVPDVKNFQNAQSMWASMQEAAGRDTAQADLNMVIAMAKLFDPTSVVRTEEGEMVRETGSLPSEIFSRWKFLTGAPGARLSKTVRQGMMQEGYSRMSGYYSGVEEASKYFTEKARRWGYRPEDVVRPFTAPQPFDLEKVVGSDSAAPVPGDPEVVDTTDPSIEPYMPRPAGYAGEWPSEAAWRELPPAARQRLIATARTAAGAGG
jgi:hypothetical protein